MNLLTASEHLTKLNKKVITKQEINAISKYINSMRFRDPSRESKDLAELFLTIINNRSYKLTKDQTEFGINWLKNRYYRKDGGHRKQMQHDFQFYEIEDVDYILKNFKEFRFIGYAGIYHRYSGCNSNLVPIYQVIGKDGRSFNYSPVHMGQPLINPARS